MADARQRSYGDAPDSLRAAGSGNDFITSLGNAARESPLSAALIGMGVLWLFTGGANTSLFGGKGRRSIFGTAAGDTTDYPGHPVGKSAGLTATSNLTAANNAAGAVTQAGRRVGEVAAASVEHGADAVSSMYTKAGEATTEAINTVSSGISGATRALQTSGATAVGTFREGLVDLFERQPLILGAVGLAVGAGIAASLPITEAEQQAMGQAADAVHAKVSDAVSQIKETATAAMEEFDRQGLTPQAAGEAVNSISRHL